MNILITHQSLVLGGTEKVLGTYLDILSQQHNITLLLTTDMGEAAFFRHAVPANVKVHSVFGQAAHRHHARLAAQRHTSPMHKLRHEALKIRERWRYYRMLTGLFRQNRFDLMIDFSDCLDKFIRLPAPLCRPCPPSLRWVHSQHAFRSSHDPKAQRRYRRIFHRHTGVVGICAEMSDNLRRVFGLPSAKVHTLPNPIDFADIAAQAEQALPAEAAACRPYILQTARLDIGKGHEELIDIYAELKRRGITHKLCFVGEGGNRTALEAKIRALGLEQDCIVLGAHRNPYPFFKHADAFVHTSEHEGLPTVLLESMACGTPVVAMDCPTGPKDILGANSEYGRLIPLHDKQAFADAVCELLASPEQQSRYREQGLRRVQDFSVENIGLQLEALLNSLTGKKQP